MRGEIHLAFKFRVLMKQPKLCLKSNRFFGLKRNNRSFELPITLLILSLVLPMGTRIRFYEYWGNSYQDILRGMDLRQAVCFPVGAVISTILSCNRDCGRFAQCVQIVPAHRCRP